MNSCTRSDYILCLILLAAAQPVLAVQYTLVKGEQYQLCRDYVAAVNAINKELPMTCEREFSPQYKEFRKIKWEPLDLASLSEELWRQMFRVMTHNGVRYTDKEAGWEEQYRAWRQRVAERIATARDVKLDRARIDIDADGKREIVYRLTRRACEPSLENLRKGDGYRPHNQYFVMEEESGEFDPVYRAISGASGTNMKFSLFFYHGRVFMEDFYGFQIGYRAEQARLAGWEVARPDGWIEVNEPKGGHHFHYAGICRIDVDYEIAE